jgi:IPT/TIG domain.
MNRASGFELPPLFDSEQVGFLMRRVQAAARTVRERRLFFAIIRRAKDDLIELESLYHDLPGVYARESTPTLRFRAGLADARDRGWSIPTPRLPIAAIAHWASQREPAPNFGPMLITRSTMRMLAYAAGIVANGDQRTALEYSAVLRGLWSRSNLLEQLHRDALDSLPSHDRLQERLRTIARDLAILSDYLEATPQELLDGAFDGFDDLGLPTWPGPDDGPEIPWPSKHRGPDLLLNPFKFPDEAIDWGPFGPRRYHYWYCNHLALAPFVLPRSTHAENITSVAPANACPGATVTIEGQGFGAWGPGDELVFGAVAIGQSDILEWSDTRIVVQVPAGGLPAGCVGFRNAAKEASRKAAWQKQLRNNAECFHFKTPFVPYVPDAAPCTGLNAFGGSSPTIHSFLLNGEEEPTVDTNAIVQFSAKVDNATHLSVRLWTSNGPVLAQAPNNPAGTVLNAAPASPFTGTDKAQEIEIYLVAENACGSVSAAMKVRIVRIPKLTIKAIEVIQAIQRCDVNGGPVDEVPLVAHKRTVVRAWVDSGISDGFWLDYVPNHVQITGQLRVFTNPAHTLLPVSSAYALPPAEMQRDSSAWGPMQCLSFIVPWPYVAGNLSMTLNVWGASQWAGDQPGWKAQASRTATFAVRRKFRIAVMFISNNGVPAPTWADLAPPNWDVLHLIDRFPLAEDGVEFLVVPGNFATARKLTSREGWGELWSDVDETNADLTHNYDVLLGLLHPHPVHNGSVRGAAKWSENGPPVALAYIEPGPVTHELTHTRGILHTSDNPDDGDSTLPPTIEDVGLHVRDMTYLSKGSASLMSPGGVESGWTSIAIWNRLFGGFA